ncbi:hldE [Symbiodinium microadriaticum]|nr:hldE [Symbiodinium microadriaticum]
MGGEATAFADLIRAFTGQRIVILGDVMLDRFIYGSVDRISPEGPIPVMSVTREVAMPGGAGNVARNVVALGGEAVLLGLIGDDDAGKELNGLLADQAGITVDLTKDAARQTIKKTRFIAAGQQLLRTDREDIIATDDKIAKAILKKLGGHLKGAGALILSDYAKGLFSDAVLQGAIKLANKKKIPVLVDPKRTDFDAYRGADLVKPNMKELRAATGDSPQDDDALVKSGQALIKSSGIGALLITRSGDGMTLLDNKSAHHMRAQAREVFDVSGAGDTVIATLALGLAAGNDMEAAAMIANAAAGIVVGKAGTAIVHPSELIMAFDGDHGPDALAAKIKSREAMADQVATWKARGLKVGFTNGCFDLLHPGHLSLIAQARAACDRLIVAVNSDASVKRLKGEDRPIQSEQDRMTVIAALHDVDAVTLFDEDTPLELLTLLVPDVLVKGADYKIDEVVGGDIVQAAGGWQVNNQHHRPHEERVPMIIVTGGAGFIGSNIVAGLNAQGREDLIIVDWLGDDDKWRNLRSAAFADIIQPEALDDFLASDRAAKIDAIIHMGAISATTETDVDLIVRSNINLTHQLWRIATDRKAKFIYASSAATYGDGEAGFDDDSDPDHLAKLAPLNAYGWSKHVIDRHIVRQPAKASPPFWAGLKFFNVYGPNEYHKGGQKSVVAHITPTAQAGDPVKLFQSHHPDYEDGGQLRDFVYVKDCVDVILWMMGSDSDNVPSGLYNIGTGKARSFKDLAYAVFAALGKDPKIDYVPTPEAIRDKYQYFTEAKMDRLRAAGYNQPMTSLEDGVKDYVQNHLTAAHPYL